MDWGACGRPVKPLDFILSITGGELVRLMFQEEHSVNRIYCCRARVKEGKPVRKLMQESDFTL